MSDAAEIKTRINSISETKKVTDAMYMISSVKMRKAKREIEKTAPYFIALREEIGELLHYIPENKNRYFQILDNDGIVGRALLLITSDKGLSGSYNHTAIKAAEKLLTEHDDMIVFPIGEYGKNYFGNGKFRVAENFNYTAAFPTIWKARKICADLLEYYNNDLVDEIDIIYTHYMTGKPEECKSVSLLPLNASQYYDSNDFEIPFGKEYHPDPASVLDGIVPSLITGFIYSVLVESYCSEQNARMAAMNTAGNNAEDMLKKLRQEYNRIRQTAITREMTELTSGTRALRKKQKKS
ncbi:MAG: ATP synthase F1 subunit gamma [Oscillospiraceae bacterium]|nr:ATP synthase F1 subunit gamma [Oscillospiraceae bacterium]MBR4343106.1 ATP synthase F1 subunit gamma [Lachnospiraceae bacterium]